MINDTWADQQKRLGLKDFSPGSQDTAAANLAGERYKAATGRDITADLADPAQRANVAKALSPTWAGLPSDPGKFTGAYNAALEGGGAAPASTAINDAPIAQPAGVAPGVPPVDKMAQLGQAGLQMMQQAQGRPAAPLQAPPIDAHTPEAAPQPIGLLGGANGESDPMAELRKRMQLAGLLGGYSG
jgi:hypothetical protein